MAGVVLKADARLVLEFRVLGFHIVSSQKVSGVQAENPLTNHHRRTQKQTQISQRTKPQLILTAYWTRWPQAPPLTASPPIRRENWKDWKKSGRRSLLPLLPSQATSLRLKPAGRLTCPLQNENQQEGAALGRTFGPFGLELVSTVTFRHSHLCFLFQGSHRFVTGEIYLFIDKLDFSS